MDSLPRSLALLLLLASGWMRACGRPRPSAKNRDIPRRGDIAQAFFEAVRLHADTARLLSDEHFTVDGTPLEAWASHKSVRPEGDEPPAAGGGGNPTVDFRGERRTNDTHQSTTNPDARLYKKSLRQGARLGYFGHVVMEHRSDLFIQAWP